MDARGRSKGRRTVKSDVKTTKAHLSAYKTERMGLLSFLTNIQLCFATDQKRSKILVHRSDE